MEQCPCSVIPLMFYKRWDDTFIWSHVVITTACASIKQLVLLAVIDFELNLIDLILNDYSQLNFSAYCSMELGRTFPSFTRYLYY